MRARRPCAAGRAAPRGWALGPGGVVLARQWPRSNDQGRSDQDLARERQYPTAGGDWAPTAARSRPLVRICGEVTRTERTAHLLGVIVPFVGVLAAVVLLWNRAVDAADLAILATMYLLTAV